MQLERITNVSFKNNTRVSYSDCNAFASVGFTFGESSSRAKRTIHPRISTQEVNDGQDEEDIGDGRNDYEIKSPSYIDGLLCDIYDRWNNGRQDSFDSDTFTECSSTSEFMCRSAVYKEEWEKRYAGQLRRAFLETKTVEQLLSMVKELRHSISVISARIVRQLKHRDRRMTKLNRHSDVITAILQAASLKRRIDTRMRFSIAPCSDSESAFHQWRDAMKAVARLPSGIPGEFRRTVWLNLADQYIGSIQVDWDRTLKFVFNERSNPDDHKLGVQIVKDLHRTGCGGFSGLENDEDRAILKRVLLAYARWNKTVGYCQGFNVIAALLLNVMESREDHALKLTVEPPFMRPVPESGIRLPQRPSREHLQYNHERKSPYITTLQGLPTTTMAHGCLRRFFLRMPQVMIYLIDYVIPNGYFANNLRALSVDMAVFRDLLRLKFPKLSRHLDYLQHSSGDRRTGLNYEPPLTNVFTMQWFLTLFATCLPKYIVLRIWDCVLLEGSEILLRSALMIWSHLSSHMMAVGSADEFYTVMGYMCQDLMEGRMCNADDMVKSMYELGPFPFPLLTELREKYTYNITPFSVSGGGGAKKGHSRTAVLSDEEELDEDDLAAITCFTGSNGLGYQSDISAVGPGAYGAELDQVAVSRPVYLERMTTDIGALKKQYCKLKHRQAQAHIILASVSARQNSVVQPAITPKIDSHVAMNHLFINKDKIKNRNRYVTTMPFITSEYPKNSDLNIPFRYPPDPNEDPDLTTEAVQSLSDCEFRDRAGSTLSDMSEYSATSVISGDTKREENRSPCSDHCSENGDSAIMKECAPLEKLMLMDSLPSPDYTDCVDDKSLEGEKYGAECVERDKGNFEMTLENTIDEATVNGVNVTNDASNGENISENGVIVQSVAVIEQTSINSMQKGESALKYQKSASWPAKCTRTQSVDGYRHANEDKTVENTAIFLYQAHKRRQTRISSTSSCVSASPVTGTDSLMKTARPYNPFPIRHVNNHRAVNGLKLGLYTPEVLQAYSNISGVKPKVPLSKTKKFFSIVKYGDYKSSVWEERGILLH